MGGGWVESDERGLGGGGGGGSGGTVQLSRDRLGGGLPGSIDPVDGRVGGALQSTRSSWFPPLGEAGSDFVGGAGDGVGFLGGSTSGSPRKGVGRGGNGTITNIYGNGNNVTTDVGANGWAPTVSTGLGDGPVSVEDW